MPPDECPDCADVLHREELYQRGYTDAQRGHWAPPIHDGLGLFPCAESYKRGHLSVAANRPADARPMDRPASSTDAPAHHQREQGHKRPARPQVRL